MRHLNRNYSRLKAPTAARSFQAGRTSAPIMPQFVQTIRGENAGTGIPAG
jgi:hypothetical protein